MPRKQKVEIQQQQPRRSKKNVSFAIAIDEEDPGNIAASLRRDRQRLKEKENEVFTVVFDLCIKHIKYLNSLGGNHCRFTIPLFLSGYPLYDIRECADAVVKKLRASGFTTAYFQEPDLIYAQW